MKKSKKGSFKKPEMQKKEYFEAHLKAMDEVKKKWCMNAMKTWTKEDYTNYAKFHMWMFGIEEGKHETD